MLRMRTSKYSARDENNFHFLLVKQRRQIASGGTEEMKIETELLSLYFLYTPFFRKNSEAALRKLQNLYEITFHVAAVIILC